MLCIFYYNQKQSLSYLTPQQKIPFHSRFASGRHRLGDAASKSVGWTSDSCGGTPDFQITLSTGETITSWRQQKHHQADQRER